MEPRTRAEVAALEARYRPFDPASAWSAVGVDAERWRRHAETLRDAVRRADPDTWERVRAAFLRAAALDSNALAALIRPVPELTTVVLRSSISDEGWSSVVEATGVVVECHRRALVVAADAAEAGRRLDEDLIARIQDLIVESQRTYTVTTDGNDRLEVELPKRQYKSASNFLLRTDRELVPFAPADEVAAEMARLAAELDSEAFAKLHPVVQSAYTHVAMIQIHPFADGNGRLARTLACIPLLREVGLPQLILADQWPGYLQALLTSNEDDPQEIVDLFLAAQINSMDLAYQLIESAAGAGDRGPVVPRPPESPERTLIDLVAVHLREAIGAPEPDDRVAVHLAGADRDAVRVVITDADGSPRVDLAFVVEPADGSGWFRLASSAGDVLEVSREDLLPVPVEIVHLRVRAWLDRSLRLRPGLGEAVRIRGLFVLGSPRSGTTLIGNWLGSHPDVLGLGEYGGFYIANSVAPAYLNRLPGHQHDSFLFGLRRLAADHVSRVAKRKGCTWFCDATPWNLEVAGTVAGALPDAIFVLMLRHFSGAVLSLRQFPWAGESWEDAARVWVDLNGRIDQLPEARTIVVGYDALAAQPAETIAGIGEALDSLGLDPGGFDDRQFAFSHAHIVGEPRSTVADVVDGRTVFHPMPSLDAHRWTPEVHAAVWPVVADTHQALLARFAGAYEAPPRPDHVPEDEW